MHRVRFSRSHRLLGALSAAVTAVLLFIGGIVSNLLANELEALLGKWSEYRSWLYVAGGVSLAAAVVLAIRERKPSTDNDDRAIVVDPNERRLRQTMIEHQRFIWINGVLHHSLWNDTLITLGLAERPEAVAPPWRHLLAERRPGQADALLPDGASVAEVYDRHQGSLLILGAPGSGKTTLLLDLMRRLLDRAEQDETHPIPVKFDLSAWGNDRPPLEQWLVAQLRAQYGVSQRLAEAWVTRNRILPLLDGLDEVAEERRAACVKAINAYRAEHSLESLVVCCREREYAALPDLRLNGAVVVQPLSRKQIDDFLRAGGKHLAGVRRLLAEDPALLGGDGAAGAVAATPLMLSIIAFAYADVPAVRLRGVSMAERRAEVFDRYIERALPGRTSRKTRASPMPR